MSETPLDVERLAQAYRLLAIPTAGPWAEALPEHRAYWIGLVAPLAREYAALAQPSPESDLRSLEPLTDAELAALDYAKEPQP